MTVRTLGYAVIGTRDLDAWRRFATESIGMMATPAPEIAEGPSAIHLRLDDRPLRVRVEQHEREAFLAAGWELADSSAFEAAIEALQAAGTKVERGSDELCATRCARAVARFCDPSGNPHELYHGTIYDHQRFVSPVGGAGFETGDMGLGHVVLPTRDIDSCSALFRNALGFRVSDTLEAGLRIAFMRCNPRHHSLAFASFEQPTGLVHLMVELQSLDDVGYALDRVKAAGHHLSATLGKHTNDQMVSFYVRTPSGFDIEVGCGGIRVDNATWTTGEITAPSFWGHEWDFGG